MQMGLFYDQIVASDFTRKTKSSSSSPPPCHKGVKEEVVTPTGQSMRWKRKMSKRSREKHWLNNLVSHITLYSQWCLLFISRRSRHILLIKSPTRAWMLLQIKRKTAVVKEQDGFMKGEREAYLRSFPKCRWKKDSGRYRIHETFNNSWLENWKQQNFQFAPEYESTWKDKFQTTLVGMW